MSARPTCHYCSRPTGRYSSWLCGFHANAWAQWRRSQDYNPFPSIVTWTFCEWASTRVPPEDK